MVPSIRIQDCNQKPSRLDGDYVLYWMMANRRTRFNFALDRAIEIANDLQKPLLIVENLRSDYEWACDRFHRFVVDGMLDNQQDCETNGISYLPFVESPKQSLNGWIEKLAAKSAAVVTDDNPAFFYPALHRLMSRRIPVALQAVDSVGLMPLRTTEKVYSRAHFYRKYVQQTLPDHLVEFPAREPFDALENKSKIDLSYLPNKYQPTALETVDSLIEKLPIDHSVQPCAPGQAYAKGGSVQASRNLERFVQERIQSYSDKRNYPQEQATSFLSGHLHFGQISPHEIFDTIAKTEKWSPDHLAPAPTQKALGWWGMSEDAENYLDQLVVWRELGFNMASKQQNYRKFSSLPPWAQKTLQEHRHDVRQPCYTEQELDEAQTDDPLWNAAQNQLRHEGLIHNYLRMLWGKKILQWTESPEEALRIMVHLNNKYAIDGRDPNSYSGIFWILGRYDRAWGPERQIFGKIRYMTSENTARKFPVKQYVEKYTADQQKLPFAN